MIVERNQRMPIECTRYNPSNAYGIDDNEFDVLLKLSEQESPHVVRLAFILLMNATVLYDVLARQVGGRYEKWLTEDVIAYNTSEDEIRVSRRHAVLSVTTGTMYAAVAGDCEHPDYMGEMVELLTVVDRLVNDNVGENVDEDGYVRK